MAEEEEPEVPAAPVPEAPKPEKRCRDVLGVPWAGIFILAHIFCERFMYYGMRVVLMLYLTEDLKVSEEFSKSFFHGFIFFNYFVPLVGAIVADAFTGKFILIAVLVVFYFCGSTLMAATSPSNFQIPRLELAMVSLAMIAIGSGAIKPCTAAFAGDQFPPEATKARDNYFNAYYFAVNLGAVIAMFLTPILRVGIKCIPDNENCYPASFGISDILMFFAIVFFFGGIPLYKRNPAQGSVILKMIKCIWRALIKKCTVKRDPKPSHWLEYADDKFDATTIAETKAVLRVSLIMTPIPMFWALFDQQGSAWTLQSSRMDGETVFGQVLPDQMDTFNSILVLIFIPLFSMGVYPLFKRCRLLRTPLQRIGAGMVFAASSYFVGGILYIIIESGYPSEPSSEVIDLSVLNAMPCKVHVTLGSQKRTLPKYSSEQFVELDPEGIALTAAIDKATCPGQANITKLTVPLVIEQGLAYSLALFLQGNETIGYRLVRQDRQREMTENRPKARFFYSGINVTESKYLLLRSAHLKLCVLVNSELKKVYEQLNKDNDKTTVCFRDPTKACDDSKCKGKKQVYGFARGGIYDVIIKPEKEPEMMDVLVTAQPDSVPILTQIPQYMLLTAGEIMTSVTCLSFAYSESPESTKSVVQAVELLTVSVGSLYVIIIDGTINLIWSGTYLARSMVFLIYAVLMLLDTGYFWLLARKYTYYNELYQTIK